VTVQLTPTSVPQRGVSGRLAFALFALALVVVVGIGLLGEGPGPRQDRFVAIVAPPTPVASPRWPRPVYARVETPPPAATCATPRIVPLRESVPRHPRPLVRTDLVTMTAWSGAVDALVADRADGLWGLGEGRLLRLDAEGRLTGSWTYTDDAGFGNASLLPARDGGVWLYGAGAIRLFDGDTFLDDVPSPTATWVYDLAEARDGSLWAATDLGLFHWDGSAWAPVCRDGVNPGVGQIALDGAGDLWAQAPQGSADFANPSRFDGRTWSTPGGETLALDVPIVSAPDGRIWGGTGPSLARFDGTAWVSMPGSSFAYPSVASMTIAHDGSVWAVQGPDWVGAATEGTPLVTRYDGRSWVAYGPDDGLPAGADPGDIRAVAVADDRAFVATSDGVYRLSGDAWARTTPAPADVAPAVADRIVAVSHDEAWALGSSGLWHFRDGGWTRVRAVDPPTQPYQPVDLVRGPDGTIAAAMGRPVVVSPDGDVTVLGDTPVTSVAFSTDGRTLVGAASRVDGLGRLLPGLPLVVFTFDGRRWTERSRSVPDPAQQLIQGGTLALDRTGGIWLAATGWGCGPLLRFDGSDWGDVGPADGPSPACATDVETAPNGDVWALIQTRSSSTPDERIAPARLSGLSLWTTFGPADGFLAQWAWQLTVAPDGAVWVETDAGPYRFDGIRWRAASRLVGLSNVSIAPDGTAWGLGPSGIARLDASAAEPTGDLSDQAARWCGVLDNWGAVRVAEVALGIDAAAIETRTAAIATAQGVAQDPAAYASILRLDGDYVRACETAYAGAH
jgi:hypothetical protein